MRTIMPWVVLLAVMSVWGCGDDDGKSFGQVDLNKDGKVIFEEGVIAYPDLTVEEFRLYDKDAGGALSGEEYDVFVAARKSGQAPTPQTPAQPAAPPAQPAQAEIPAAPTPPPAAPPAGDSPAPPSVSQQGPQTAAPAPTPPAPVQPPAVSVQETAPAEQALSHVEVSSMSPAAPAPEPEPEKKPAAPVAYTVQPGDTLNKIARKFGVSAKDIIAANRIDNPDRVEAGKVLDIPQGGDSSGAAREAAPEIQAFVAEFFAKSGAESPEALLELYADEVDFYKKGVVSKDFVRTDKATYFQRWPKREYTPSGKPKVTDVPGTKRRRIEVPVRYQAKNAEKTATGEVVFVFEVVSDGGSPRIVFENSGAAVKK